MNFTLEKIYYHSLLLVVLITTVGALVYKVYALGWIGISITLLLVFILYYIILSKITFDNPSVRQPRTKTPLSDYILLSFFLVTFIFSFIILLKSQTTAALVSPWQTTPWYFFLFLAFLLVLLVLQIEKHSKLTLLSIVLFYFLVFSIAIILFPLGFGFDPFVHQATLELIAENGVVTPKPLYYLGQYALLTIFDKIPFVPLTLLHFYLVPLLAAMSIPTTLFLVLTKWLKSKRAVLYAMLALLIIPFGIFIFTTPQNLAFLFLTLIIILGLKSNSWKDLVLIYALALAALACQPIAGIPAIIFALALTLYHSNIKNKKNYLSALFFLLVIALPLAFVIVNRANNQISDIGEAASSALLSISNPSTENIILNTIYFYAFNLRLVLLILALSGIIIACRNRKVCNILFLYFLSSLSLFASYLITSKLNFSYLIFYEQSNFANRILILSFLFLLPFIIFSLAAFINKLREQNRFMQISFAVFIVFLILISTYLSYPRFDNYHNSHSYTVSQNDINAVNWIENNTASEDYIVLANQQVSAAALHEFGFKKYYVSEIGDRRSEIFYYPVPTGGPLYKFYLDMVYVKPSRETMVSAMDLARVDEAYFVLNKYWWAFDKILAEAKLEANSYEIIDKGEVYVFRYLK